MAPPQVPRRRTFLLCHIAIQAPRNEEFTRARNADPLGRGARECLLASVPEAPDPIRTRLAFEPKGSLSQRKACPL